MAWRAVVQLNLLRNVNTILDALAQEMSAPLTAAVDDGSDDESIAGPSNAPSQRPPPLRFTEEHRVLRLRLLPLRSVQEDLQARLGAADWPTPKQEAGGKARPQDFFVWSNAGWKNSPSDAPRSMKQRRASEESETAGVLASCADDIKALWKNETVQTMLRKRRMRLDLMPGL